jgi:hypothetical protein
MMDIRKLIFQFVTDASKIDSNGVGLYVGGHQDNEEGEVVDRWCDGMLMNVTECEV